MSNDILNAVQEYMINGHVSDAPFIINDYVITLERLDNGVRISATRGGQTESVVVYDGDLTNLNHEVLANRNANDQHPINAISGLRSELDSKQPVISDLEQIRTNAGKGTTAVQHNELSNVAMTGSYNDLNGKPNLARVATSGSYNDLVDKPSMVLDHNNLTGRSGYNQHPMSSITGLIDNLNGKQGVISDLSEIRANARKADTAVQPSDLARVATTGSYNDLTDKPTVFGNEVEVGPTPEDADLWIDTSESGSNVDPSVRWDVGQSLTDAQKERARNNIGAVSGSVSDVQVNGTSVVTDGVANVPIIEDIPAYNNPAIGIVKVHKYTGLKLSTQKALMVKTASYSDIDRRYTVDGNDSGFIDPKSLPYAVKSAMAAPVSTTDPAWTAAEQAAARERIGAYPGGAWNVETITLTTASRINLDIGRHAETLHGRITIPRGASTDASGGYITLSGINADGSVAYHNLAWHGGNSTGKCRFGISAGMTYGTTFATSDFGTVLTNLYSDNTETIVAAKAVISSDVFPAGTRITVYYR